MYLARNSRERPPGAVAEGVTAAPVRAPASRLPRDAKHSAHNRDRYPKLRDGFYHSVCTPKFLICKILVIPVLATVLRK